MYFSHNRTSEVAEKFQWLRSIIFKVKEAKETNTMSDIRLNNYGPSSQVEVPDEVDL